MALSVPVNLLTKTRLSTFAEQRLQGHERERIFHRLPSKGVSTPPEFIEVVTMNLRLFGISIVAGLILYAASYAPYLRFKFGADWLPSESEGGFYCAHINASDLVNTHTFYHPIEILIDRTPCKKFFLKWGNLWNVQYRCELDHKMRRYDQWLNK